MKILHFAVWDEKFLPLARELYEEAFPGANEFRILPTKLYPCANLRESPGIVKVTAEYFCSDKLREESADFDVLVAHSMLPPFAAGIKHADPGIFVVWCGWGYDYYSLMTSEFGGLFLPDTVQLAEKAQAHRRFKNRFRPASLAKSIKQRLLSLFHEMPPPQPVKGETLESVAGRINLFSVLPTEITMLQRALPGLKAEYRPILYYTTEDVLAKGPARMSGRDILLGNSPTPANNHIEALKMLKPLLPENSSIIAPLNYGDPDKVKFYGDSISRFGAALFGDRFKPLRTWMPLEKYHEYLSRCGIVIMNHRRQQGLGTISTALYKGAKVFLRPENPVYEWYLKMGVTVFSTDELLSPSKETLEPLQEKIVERNSALVGAFWSRKNAVAVIRGIEELLQPRTSRGVENEP